MKYYLKDFILTLLGLGLLSLEKNLTDLILIAFATVGLFTGRFDLAKPFIFGGGLLTIIPPYFSLPGLQTLSVLLLLRVLGWRLIKTNILTLTVGEVLARSVIESFIPTDIFGVLIIYLLLVVRRTWTIVLLSPLLFFNRSMLLPGFYVLFVKHFRLDRSLKLILFLGSLVAQYLVTGGEHPVDLLAQLYGPLFPILFLTIHPSNLRFNLIVFGMLSSEYMFIFFKSNPQSRTFRRAIPFMLLMAYVSSRTLPRIAQGWERVGVVTLPYCEEFKRTQTGVCNIFLDLWDQGLRLCFQNQIANQPNDCKGRLLLPLAGVASSGRSDQ